MLLFALFIVLDLLPILITVTCISSNLELFRYQAPKFQQEAYTSFICLLTMLIHKTASYDVDNLVITACYLVFTMSFFGLFHHS